MNFTMYAKFSHTVRSHGIDHAISEALRLGFSSVEFFEFVGPTWTPVVPDVETARRYRERLEANGLSVACFSVAVGLCDLNAPDRTDRAAEDALKHYVDCAAALGSPLFHHTLTLGVPGDALSYDEMLAVIVPAAVRIARYAEVRGVSCIYEDQGPYFNGVEGFGPFFRAVKAEVPSVGVCGDIGNTLFVDEDSLPFFRAFVSEFRHVHVKDYVTVPENTPGAMPSRGGVWLNECVIGEGILHVDECLDVLKKADYRGAFGFENNHTDVSFDEGVAIGMKRINAIMQD